ncbi:MAG: DNA mismatch repair endonuclease MutL [Proteobacteria bacterium]|nr:DNA mismatch repair endonuclease MutL [Pseudomonadota bacterium]
MQKIKILSENLANMIAAGEVVERPVSVVKELVENAIDAGSSKIDIHIRDGGKRLIRVADNGEGMSREDALLSLERHATSKIDDPSDLFNITTMGFRGEALASIASISRFTLSTREKDAIEGSTVILEGGVIKDVRATGMPSGTIVEVKDLFYNTPARRKFLKTNTTEMGHINDFVARTALAFPSISLTLRTDNSVVFDLPAGSDLKERISNLLGKDDAKDLLEISAETEALSLSGLISPPSVQRSSGSALYFYVNGRYVKDKVIRHALLQGYGNYIMKGKYPLAILFVETDPAEVDVNVHPAKSEVKFRDSRALHSLVHAGIERTLNERQWLSETDRQGEVLSAKRIRTVQEAAAHYVSNNENLPLRGGHVRWEGESSGRHSSLLAKAEMRAANLSKFKEAEELVEKGPAWDVVTEGYFSSLNVTGQIGEMYIVCEGRNGMVIIDQHAAYERITFEELKRGYEKRSFKVQQLLMPETVELTHKEASALEENLEDIQRLGFEIEHFGGKSFVIKAIPSIFGNKGSKAIVTDMASELSELPKSGSFKSAFEEIIKRIACHSVVRGRRRMNIDEMRALLTQMDESGIVPHCPHGRPAHIDIPISELEKRFERV